MSSSAFLAQSNSTKSNNKAGPSNTTIIPIGLPKITSCGDVYFFFN